MAEKHRIIDPGDGASMSLRNVWNYLSLQEENETDWSLKDDLRIIKRCILEVEKNNPDPWRYAFWQYMGTTFEKWQGVLAERQAYEKLLGPTLAEELQNPLFLASLEPLVRSAGCPPSPR